MFNMGFYNKYVENHFKGFFKTFMNKKLPLVLFLDFIYYVLFYLGFKIFFDFFKRSVDSLTNINLGVLNDLTNISSGAANQLLDQLRSFLISIIGGAVVFILFIVVILTLVKGYEWGKIVRKKLVLFDYVKLLVLNFLWAVVWIIIMALPLGFVAKEVYLPRLYYFIPFIIYFTFFLHAANIKGKSLLGSLKSPFVDGLLKLYLYVSPLVLIVLFLEILFVFSNLINISNVQAILIVFFIVISVILAVSKLYFYSIYNKAK